MNRHHGSSATGRISTVEQPIKFGLALNFRTAKALDLTVPPRRGDRIKKPKLIEYSFGDRKAQVEFTRKSDGCQSACYIRSESTHSVEQQRQGWQSILNNFARHVQ